MNNILSIATLFLLAFIPLYPKLPLLDIVNTWVYVRVEDFLVVGVLLIWITLILRKKISLKTPLTMPILLFWIIGGLATFHGVLLIFPTLANVYPNVAFLSFIRRIEYISLFFIAYSSVKNKRFLTYTFWVLFITFLGVLAYGIGQKYLGFPAFLTMNEEFAKGAPIQLSALSRLPSTFGGHYDLAAYLVLVIPIFASMMFVIRNLFIKLGLGVSIVLGFFILLMTVSRVSVFALIVSLFALFFFKKKKAVLIFLPVLAIFVFLFLSFKPALLARFGNTVKQVDVLVEANSGEPIGYIKEASSASFEHKLIKRIVVANKEEFYAAVRGKDLNIATPSAILPFSTVPPTVTMLVPPTTPTGEDLPSGTSYINLALSPVSRKVGQLFYENASFLEATNSARVLAINGNFLIKKAGAYDLSFTTRFQGEWPHAIEAFMRNIFLGSGYGSISLAIDNNYLRILGEIGLLGFASFLGIFITLFVYIKKILPKVDSPFIKSFVIGFAAGVGGLALNAVLIDVFEASKIAFQLWILTGIVLGTLHLYETKEIDQVEEFKKVASSNIAIIIYLSILAMFVFLPMLSNYFVGDDFTWFRWAADKPSLLHYFTQSDGFFYRPGTKVYFFLMYSLFWLNQTVYHFVSIFLHFTVAVLFFFLAKRILRDKLFAALSAFLFLILSGYSEAIFWISSTGFLFTTAFSLSSLLLYALWDEKKKMVYLIFSTFFLVLGLLFHELGIVTPLLILLYKYFIQESFNPKTLLTKLSDRMLFLPIGLYLLVRFIAGSHWLSGDYNYNIIKVPFNTVGNAIGYFTLTLVGPLSLSVYEKLRNFSRENILFAITSFLITGVLAFFIYRFIVHHTSKSDRKIIIFSLLFFVIGLLPFLALGNITSRYSYLGSIGLVLLFSFIIKKLYEYMLDNGKNIAVSITTIILISFSLLHIIQIQQIHSDWYEAGEVARRFFVAIDSSYEDYWAQEPMVFHFVNVPIRKDTAWIFPVGLSDALWLVFRNPNIAVFQDPTLTQAFNEATGIRNDKIFEFKPNGTIIEHHKTLSVQ